jgi:hypothetical protein
MIPITIRNTTHTLRRPLEQHHIIISVVELELSSVKHMTYLNRLILHTRRRILKGFGIESERRVKVGGFEKHGAAFRQPR